MTSEIDKTEIVHTVAREDINRAIDIFKHTEIVRTYRTSFNLVAQSMLITAFVTILTSPNVAQKGHIETTITVLGIAFAAFQFRLMHGQSVQMKSLKENYLLSDRVFMTYANAYQNKLGSIQQIWMPAFLLSTWISLIYFSRI